jgi:Putative phage tail protein
MATLIFGAVGGLVGGRIGQAVGAAIGSVVDSAIFAPAPRQGPRLAELSVQTSTYGAPIPKLFGRTRVAGTVIWSTDLIESRTRQSNGKGRGSTDVYSYSASFAVLLSARRTVRVERIWADGKLLRGAAGDLKTPLAALRVHVGDEDQPPDPLIAAAEGTDAPAFRGSAYAVFEGLQLGDYGNRIPSLSFEVVADEAGIGVGSALGELAGVAADAGPVVSGLVASGGSVGGFAQNLGAAFAMAVVDQPELRLRFGDGPVATLAPEELGAATGATAVPTVVRSVAALETTARTLMVAYSDPSRDYKPGSQRAHREGGGRREERIDLPVVMPSAGALSLATTTLGRRGNDREMLDVALPPRAVGLRPGQAVSLDGQTWRVVETRFEAMTVKLSLRRAQTAAAAFATAEPGRDVAEADRVHGPTRLALIDLPPLTDGVASAPLVGVLAGGTSGGWRRAVLSASADGGATFADFGMTAAPACLGVTLQPLPMAPAHIEDRIHAVEVQLDSADDMLFDADVAALLAGANRALLGDELIQFGIAAPTSAGRWRLSRLWRGRRGTEDQIAVHSAGTRFALLDSDAIRAVPGEFAVAGLQIMAAGVGDSAPWPAATVASVGRAMMPLAPVHLVARALAGGDVEIVWIRRSRDGWQWRDLLDAPLAEAGECYRVSWQRGSVDVVSASFIYTAAQRADDVLAGLTQAQFAIVQLGAAAVSPPAQLSIPLV